MKLGVCSLVVTCESQTQCSRWPLPPHYALTTVQEGLAMLNFKDETRASREAKRQAAAAAREAAAAERRQAANTIR